MIRATVLAVAMATGMAFMAGSAAQACSFVGTQVFEPNQQGWEPHWTPLGQGSEHGIFEPIPVPVVEIAQITRAQIPQGTSCDDVATLFLHVSLPETSTYAIDEFGIYFRVRAGKDLYFIIPNDPMVGHVVDDHMEILLPWGEGPPSTQVVIDLTVEAFFVTHDLRIGPVAEFTLFAD